MECVALETDGGLTEDFIWWKESYDSNAIQGEVAVRAEQMMAPAGLG